MTSRWAIIAALALVACAAPQRIVLHDDQVTVGPEGTPPEVVAHIHGIYAEASWPGEDLAPGQPILSLDASNAPRATVADWALYQIHPETQWTKLSARVVGVLFDGDPRWGEHLGHRPDQTGGQGNFLFGHQAQTPRVPYFLSDGRGDNYMGGWPRLSERRDRLNIDAARFSGQLAEAFGLDRAAQLVELEVNGGWGDVGTDPHFVATQGRVIDGTTRFPLRVDDALVMLRQRFDQQLEEPRAAVAEALASFAEDVKPHASQPTFEPVDEHIGLSASWLPDEEALVVLLYYRVHRRALGDAHRREPTCVPQPCTDGLPCAPCDAAPGVDRDTFDFGRHFAKRYTLDMQGVLLRETTYALRPFTWGLRG